MKNMKIIGMIPARLGSTRVKNKNLRLLDDKPLIQHIVDAAKGSELLDSIYINSESNIFEEIALLQDVNFYKRNDALSSNEATNDDFAIDFIKNTVGDILIQLLPTSPFITSSEIDCFIKEMIDKKYDTLVSVSNVQIESLFNQKPLNFDHFKKTPPSQELTPVKAYACGIMGWRYENFKMNIEKYSAAYHGGDGKVGYFDLSGYSLVDIDNEEDFLLAEAIINAKKIEKKTPQYYNKKIDTIADANRKRILEEDGVINNELFQFNREIVHINEIISNNSDSISWSHTLINSPSNCATLIAQMPGEGNRRHHHPEWDEWWYILQGEWKWEIEGTNKIVKKGDVVFISRNRIHKITADGTEMAIRLAVSRADVDHVYAKKDF